MVKNKTLADTIKDFYFGLWYFLNGGSYVACDLRISSRERIQVSICCWKNMYNNSESKSFVGENVLPFA